MMRNAVRNNPNRVPRSATQQIAAPVKGWTAKGTPVDADPLTALVLKNWFPEAESLDARAGFVSHATRVATGGVETLMSYTSATASALFACGGGNIFNITTAGSYEAATADVSSLTEDQWNYEMFSTAAGQFLVCANGADSVRNYDGSAWTTPSITGVTSSTLIYPTAHKSRLWFVQAATTDLWYLPTLSIAGAATKFPVGALMKRGGYPMAIGTWSVDAGDGLDDMLVIYTSEGEVIIYQGTDPASANTWVLVGVYRIGRPIGRRCLFKVGGDLAMLTEDGIIPVGNALKLDRAVMSASALTANITDAFTRSVRRARDSFGWQMLVFPIRNMAIVNVPGSGSEPTKQYVMNSTTGAWCWFEGLNAQCWVVHDNSLYFGSSDGNVYQADTGATDEGEDIELAVLPAYSHLSARGRLKHVKMVQPIFSSDLPDVTPSVSIATDYQTPTDNLTARTAQSGFFTWGTSTWGGTDIWYNADIREDWRGAGGLGSVISPYTTATVNDSDATNLYRYSLTGWSIVYEVGGVL